MFRCYAASSGVSDPRLRNDPQYNISRNIRWILTSPAKAITTPFAYTMPKSAWDIMLRRTVTLFYTPDELQSYALQKADADIKMEKMSDTYSALPANDIHLSELKPGSGALSVFLQKLYNNEQLKSIPITLVGHSMGAIVVDNIILQEPRLNYKNIVHLASAASVSNVFSVITPYIKRKIKEKEHSVGFYSLMLHPDNEDREEAWKGFVPSGSLLTWIDNMYTSPQTVMDKRSGRWDNIKKVIKFIPEEVKQNMHFKIFGIKEGKSCLIPQEHGDFDEIPFWREETWK
jgi:hypothetical protein